MNKTHRFQFGNVYQRKEPGWKLLSRIYELPWALWLSLVNEDAHIDVESALYEGFVSGEEPASFAVGIDATTAVVHVHCFGNGNHYGPFSITIDGKTVGDDIQLEDEEEVFEFETEISNQRIDIGFVPDTGASFLVNGIEVVTSTLATPVKLFATAPELPSITTKTTQREPSAMLSEICSWLTQHTESSDFPGDDYLIDSNTKVPIWYSITFPVRTFLAGYLANGDKTCLSAVTNALDAFVSEQLPNGAWADHYRRCPTSTMDSEQAAFAMQSLRQPLSDIGSVAACLGLSAPHVDTARSKRYLTALERYCESWAAGFQAEDGSFNDGYDGHSRNGSTYSCATAIEAGLFAIAGTLLGRADFSERANRAIRFLLPDWRENGRMIGRAPHWPVRNRKPFLFEPTYFGDMYYYDEGFTTVLHHTKDESLAEDLRTALKNRVRGASGLLSTLGEENWWVIQDTWNNAKSIGMIATLLEVQRHIAPGKDLEETITRLMRFLTTSEFSAVLGVMPDDTERPANIYGMQTWSGTAGEATGFAGMILGELLVPKSMYGL
jgi:hypothetical protein